MLAIEKKPFRTYKNYIVKEKICKNCKQSLGWKEEIKIFVGKNKLVNCGLPPKPGQILDQNRIIRPNFRAGVEL